MEENGKPMMFLLIGAILLILAFFYPSLESIDPALKPVADFIGSIGTSILCVCGYFAVVIALFLWLPTWISLLLFLVVLFLGGYYIKGETGISLKINENQILPLIDETQQIPQSDNLNN
jgi:glucan phosphoethanolaminetransferase (alkaline phosphatase superfamily)